MAENGVTPDPPGEGAEDVDAQGEEWSRERQAGAMLPVLSLLTSLAGLSGRAESHAVETAARDRLRPRQALVLESMLTGATQTESAATHEVGLRSVQRWVADDETFKAALKEGMADLRSSTRPLMIDGYRRGVMTLVELCESGNAKIALGAAAALTRLYRPEGVEGLTGHDLVEDDTDAEWDRLYTMRGQQFLPHEKQLAAILCMARFLVLVAGVQSGKTDTGAINFWSRIKAEDNPHAVYWMIAPDTTTGAVMRKRFVRRAPEGWLPNPEGHGQDYARYWTLKNGATVQFRSADRPTKLVAETLSGMWLDEFTLMRSSVWHVSLRARLATTKGWVIFTGTPRGPNWGFNDIWRRTDPTDDLYAASAGDWVGFTWHSVENPLITAQEVADAKATLPPAYYAREWEASWDAFHGQVYPDFGKHCIWNLTKQLTRKKKGELIDCGVDWGWAKPGAFVVGRLNVDDSWDVLEEVHQAKELSDWWIEEAKRLHRKFGINTFWCDNAEPDRIVELRRALRKWALKEKLKVPKVKPASEAKVSRWPGIRYVASLFKQSLVRVHRSCETFAAQHTGYKFKEDQQGDDLDEIEKKNDHTCDAFRYMVFERKAKGRHNSEIVMGAAG